MKLLSFLVFSFVILSGIFSILLLTNFKVFAQGTYPIIVNVKFTENGSPKTFSGVGVTLLDGETGAQIRGQYANGAIVYLTGKPASLKVTIEAKESGAVVYTNTSDSFTSLPDDKFTYTPTLDVTGIINGPVGTTTTPSPSAGAGGTPTPTPPTEGPGWCGDDATVRAGFLPVPAGTTPPCTMKDAVYVPRTSSPKDAYCDKASSGAKPFFYKCGAATSGTPTPTPTPFTPAIEGAACIPSQGPWQCMQNYYCAQACSTFGASCTTGKCCPNGKVWLGTTCGAPVSTPTPAPAGATPTPITTAGKCDDAVLTAAGSVSQACVKAASCTSPDVENTGGSETCSQFYGGTKTGYVCCQKPIANTGGAGSACSLTGRPCDTTKNSSSGTNVSCTGCGGYCIGSGSTGTCQSI